MSLVGRCLESPTIRQSQSLCRQKENWKKKRKTFSRKIRFRWEREKRTTDDERSRSAQAIRLTLTHESTTRIGRLNAGRTRARADCLPLPPPRRTPYHIVTKDVNTTQAYTLVWIHFFSALAKGTRRVSWLLDPLMDD